MNKKIPGNPFSFEKPYGDSVVTVQTTRFVDGWLDVVRDVLLRHNCTLEVFADYCVVRFPEGTYKSEIFPRVGGCRFILFLPDGTEWIEIVQRNGNSLLGFNKREVPEK